MSPEFVRQKVYFVQKVDLEAKTLDFGLMPYELAICCIVLSYRARMLIEYFMEVLSGAL